MCRMFEDGALGVFYGGPWCSAADLKHCQSLPTTHTRPVGIHLCKKMRHIFLLSSLSLALGSQGLALFWVEQRGFFEGKEGYSTLAAFGREKK